MGDRIAVMVKQPAHGANGELLYQVGEYFEPGTEFPNDVVVSEKHVVSDEVFKASQQARKERLDAAEKAAKAAEESITGMRDSDPGAGGATNQAHSQPGKAAAKQADKAAEASKDADTAAKATAARQAKAGGSK